MEIRTQRLILRSWQDSDIVPFAAMCADAEVMVYFENLLSLAETEASVRRFQKREAEDGFGMWAVELPGSGFIGVAGIQRIPYEAGFTPAVEVGWRLARSFWGFGYATEAARASLAYGFGRCGLRHIVAVAVPGNARSLAVMDRIGMTRDPDGDFDHPSVTAGHPLCRHVLYRVDAP